MLFKLEGFRYSTSIYLNVVYYHIQMRKNTNSVCTIIPPWGKYRYKRLPMVVSNSPDIFQQIMKILFHVF